MLLRILTVARAATKFSLGASLFPLLTEDGLEALAQLRLAFVVCQIRWVLHAQESQWLSLVFPLRQPRLRLRRTTSTSRCPLVLGLSTLHRPCMSITWMRLQTLTAVRVSILLFRLLLSQLRRPRPTGVVLGPASQLALSALVGIVLFRAVPVRRLSTEAGPCSLVSSRTWMLI